MKKILETAGIFLAVAAMVFGYFLAPTAHAETLLIDHSGVGTDNLYNHYDTIPVVQRFSYTSDFKLTKIGMTFSNYAWPSGDGTNDYVTIRTDSGGVPGTILATTTVAMTANTTGTLVYATFSTSVQIYASTTYYIVWENYRTTGTQGQWQTLGQTSGGPSGQEAGRNFSGTWYFTSGYRYAYQVYGESNTTDGTQNDQINFNTPINGATVDDATFNFWNVNWFGGATTTNNSWYKIEIKYGTSSGGFASATLPYVDARTWSQMTWNSENGNSFGGFSIDKTIPLTQGFRYYAEANLIWETLNPVGGGAYNVVSTTTASTTALFFINTTSTFGTSTDAGCEWWTSGFGTCWLQMVFKPHDLSLNAFKATYNQLQTSPPFSYLFNYVATASNAATSTVATTTDYDVTLHFPAPWNDITMLTSSSYSNFVGTSTAFTKEKFFDIQRMVIWIGAGLKLISIFII